MNRIKHFIEGLLVFACACPTLVVAGGKDANTGFPYVNEKKIKARFEYSFNDISSKLVTVSCKSGIGRHSGSGFVATVDGKTYLFTNQHVILGAEKILFKTATGETLRPCSVELSASRDIARLLLADEAEGFETTEKMAVGIPVAVFGNSEGSGVATELYGTVTGVAADTIEVSAAIVSGNSGSPVLNLDQEVLGIASYVRWFDDDENGSKTRRFCYRIDGNHWIPVNWKKYNAEHGMRFREGEKLFESTLELIAIWHAAPYSRISHTNYSSPGLRRWASNHNLLIDRIMKLSDKGKATRDKLNSTNERIKQDIKSSADGMVDLCRTQARVMRMFSRKPGTTQFLRDAFESLAFRYELVAQEAERYSTELARRNYFHFSH